jgi:carbon monoxide dehydrogenase subunit G
MVGVSDAVYIDLPDREVFGFLDDPHNHVDIIPSLVAVEGAQPLDNGGKRAEFVYTCRRNG